MTIPLIKGNKIDQQFGMMFDRMENVVIIRTNGT